MVVGPFSCLHFIVRGTLDSKHAGRHTCIETINWHGKVTKACPCTGVWSSIGQSCDYWTSIGLVLPWLVSVLSKTYAKTRYPSRILEPGLESWFPNCLPCLLFRLINQLSGTPPVSVFKATLYGIMERDMITPWEAILVWSCLLSACDSKFFRLVYLIRPWCGMYVPHYVSAATLPGPTLSQSK